LSKEVTKKLLHNGKVPTLSPNCEKMEVLSALHVTDVSSCYSKLKCFHCGSSDLAGIYCLPGYSQQIIFPF